MAIKVFGIGNTILAPQLPELFELVEFIAIITT